MALVSLSTGTANAAINSTTYSFTSGTGTLEDMSSGTTTLVWPNSDDNSSSIELIGFDFWFDGVRHSQFSATANGLVHLGATTMISSWTNDLANATNTPQIAPYWDDLYIGVTGQVHFKVVGSAPNRKLVVEWQNAQVPRDGEYSSGAANFQLWLLETSGNIEFVYGAGMAVNSISGGYSVGFGSSSNAFASITTSGPSVAYGTGNANNTQTDAIAEGTKYSFAPLVPADPAAALSFTAIGTTVITLNWTDNASNELGYAVYRSTDGVDYTFVSQAPANATSATQTGLAPVTTYYWKVYAVTEGALSANAATGSQATGMPSLSGTYSVGPSPSDHASLTAAFLDINTNGAAGPIVLELKSDYISSVETFPLLTGSLVGSNATNTITVRPAANATALTITSSDPTGTFDINGGSHLIIDGRPGGVGATSELSISNTATSAWSLRFINEARNNTVRYTSVLGVATSTSNGVLVFSTTTGDFGNDDNTIEYCTIGNGVTTPMTAIYSAGTTSPASSNNSGNTIANCNIINFFSAFNSSAGIRITGGNTGWTITGNSLYQTSSRAVTYGYTHYGIFISGGNDYVLSSNAIGGSAPGAGGAAWTMGATGVVGGTFVGMQLNLDGLSPSSVQGNTIANYALSTSSSVTYPGIWCGISAYGLINIGTITGNTIGSAIGTGSITVTTSGSGGSSYGISVVGAGGVTIANNTIGSFTLQGSTTSISQSFIGINAGYGANTISDNLIGSLTTPNSIHCATASTSTAQSITGIFNSSTTSATISGNTIANLHNAHTGNTLSMTRGIVVTAGSNSIAGNTVRNLSSNAKNSASGSSSSLVGISATSTTGNQTITHNTLYALANMNAASFAGYVTGIYYNGPTSGTNLVDRNLVYGLSMNTISTSAYITGIQAAQGETTYQNNVVRLGLDASGASITRGYTIRGIHQFGYYPVKFYHNSVYIGGGGVVSVGYTWAMQSEASGGTRDLRNNIFVNARSNASGSAKNAAINVLGFYPGELTIDNNVLWAPGTGGAVGFYGGGTTVSTLAAWQAFTGQDPFSVNADPNFVDPTAALPDLHIVSPSVIEQGGVLIASVTDDVDGQSRAGLSPTDIGADAGDFVAVDAVPPVITLTPLTNTCQIGPRTVTATITDPFGIPTAGLGLPVLYWKVNGGSYTAATGVHLSGELYEFTFGDPAPYVSTITYYVVAQDNAGNLSSLPLIAGGMTSSPPFAASAPASLFGYTLGSTLNGTYTVGAGGTYPTLTAAVAAYNLACLAGPVVFELLDASYTAPAETFPISIQNNPDASVTNSLTIRPAAGVSASVSGSISNDALLSLTGARHVTLDGVGSGSGLTLSNTATGTGSGGTSTIRFISDAVNNTITRCTVLGSTTSNNSAPGGTITFLGGNSTGNDDNTVSFCNIGPAGANMPVRAIFGYGTSVINNRVQILNNEIFDFFNSTASSNGIYLYDGCTQWTISGNKFYQSAPRVFGSASPSHRIIEVSNYGASEGNFTISNNTLGFANALGTGTYTLSGGLGSTFRVISLSLATSAVQSNIDGNTIGGISHSTASSGSSTPPFVLIHSTQGPVSIGANAANILGSTSGPSISFSTTATALTEVYGIVVGGSNPCLVRNNQIGGITASFGATTAATLLGGINVTTSTSVGSTVADNIVGGTVAHSLRNTSTSTGAQAVGLFLSSSNATVTGNTVRNLTVDGGTGTLASASLSGIRFSSTSHNNTVSQNTIHSLTNTVATGVRWVNGIQYISSTGVNLVERNLIHSLMASSTGAVVNGIYIAGGTATYQNNMIRLGIDASGAELTSAIQFNGFNQTSTGNSNFWHNSVYIGGSNVGTGTASSFAFNSLSTNASDIRNNIFVNVRSNGASTGKHYAIQAGGTTVNPVGLISDYNFLLANGTGSFIGRFNNIDRASLIDWQTATGNDNNSQIGDPNFIAPATATPDLHIGTSTPIEASGVLIPQVVTDFDGEVRADLSQTDIGADAGDFVATDVSVPNIGYTTLANTCSTLDMTLVATITDNTGVPIVGALTPRIYYRKGIGSWFSQPGSLTGGSATNGTWSFSIIVADMGGVAGLDAIQYYVIAQDGQGNVGSNPGGGLVATDVNTVSTAPTPSNSYTIVNTLAAGTYTVGIGGAYPTLTAAVATYNTSCLGGPVVFSLIDATYPSETFPITVNGNADASTTNRLTIKPATGVSPLLTGNSINGLLRLNGADHVTIDGSNTVAGTTRDLTITNANTGASVTVWLNSVDAGNGATHNTVKNCSIFGNSTTVALATLMSSGATLNTAAETGNTGNSFENNSLARAQYGIGVLGPVAMETGTVITGNTIGSTIATDKIGYRGLFISNQQGVLASNNLIDGVTTATTNNSVGIHVAGTASGGSIIGNRIRNIANTHTGGYGSDGIYLGATSSASNLTIANNFVSGVTGNGYTGVGIGDNGYGIAVVSGGGYNIWHNTVSMNLNQTTGTYQSAALWIASGLGAGSLDVRNNIFASSQTTGTQRYAIYCGSANSVFSAIDNNDLVTFGANLGYLGSYRLDLSAIISGFGGNANSVSITPVFISTTDLHLTGSNESLNDLGSPIAAITVDIDGDTRNVTTPDIGADEFEYSTCTGAPSAGASAGALTACAGEQKVYLNDAFNSTGGVTYTWYSSSTGTTGTWTLAVGSGVNSQSYTTPALNAAGTQYLVMSALCTASGDSTLSNVINLSVGSPTINVSNSGNACSGTLTASGASTYTWSPATYLSSTTGASVDLVGATSHVAYTITGTDVNGCVATTQFAVGLSISAEPPAICGTGGTSVLTASGSDFSYAWSALGGGILDSPTGNPVNATSSQTGSYQLTATGTGPNAGCTFNAITSVGVYPLPAATMTLSANNACPGTLVTVSSGLVAGNFSYSSITNAAHTAPPSATTLVTGGAYVVTPTGANYLLDDFYYGNVPLPFSFNYFGNSYSAVNIGSNGALTFGTPVAAELYDFTFTALPNIAEPGNLIAACAHDMIFSTNAGQNGTLRYWTDGYAPNRVFIVEYANARMYNNTLLSTIQVHLFETIGMVEVHVTSSAATSTKVVGVQNGTKTIGATALSTTAPTSNQAWRFQPPSNYTTAWTINGNASPNGTNVFSINQTPGAGSTIYGLSYTDQTTGCTNSSGSATITYTQLPLLAISTSPVSPVISCPGGSLQLTASATGGKPPYSYTWTNPEDNVAGFGDLHTANSAGQWTVSVSDNCGVTVISHVNVASPPAPTGTTSGGGVVCSNAPLPSVSFAFTGVGPWSFTYSGPGGTSVSGHSSNTYTITNTQAGTYALTALNDANCVASSLGSSVTVVVNDAPITTAVLTNASCSNTTDGAIDLSVSGNGPFTLAWTSTVDCASASQCPTSLGTCAGSTCTGTDEDLTDLPLGTYSVTVTDVNSCTAVTAFDVISISPDSDSDGTADCLDACPNDPNKIAVGTCGCGVADTDSDSDLTADCNDGCPTDPLKVTPGTCGCGVSDVDSDADGTANCNDACPNDPNKTQPGSCGCGTPDIDSDGDGTANCNDSCPADPLKTAPGACGCGVSDTDSDNDGTANCEDDCPHDALKTSPGQCGCGFPDTDTDNDGTADCNDGCPNDPNKIAPGNCGCGATEASCLDCAGVPNGLSVPDACGVCLLPSDPSFSTAVHTLSFTGATNYQSAVMFPQIGAPSGSYTVEVIYTNSENGSLPAGWPRAILDFEGNGVFTNSLDRTVLMSAVDAADLTTSDGKLYRATVLGLALGSNWQTRVITQSGACIAELGPFNYPDVLTAPDLEIFANDITFSEPNPAVSSALTVSATVHNNASQPATNVLLHLVNQFDPGTTYPDLTVAYIGANASTTVSWTITTPSVPAWCPIQVFVDADNSITESNELNNTAIRPFTNGGFIVPGTIQTTASSNPPNAYQGSDLYVAIQGIAEYQGTGLILPDYSVAGGTVTVSIAGGGTFTGLTNSNGFYSVPVPTTGPLGLTNVSVQVTDFTLTSTSVSTSYTQHPPLVCLPDLVAMVFVPPGSIVSGQVLSGSVRVRNQGCAATTINTILELATTSEASSSTVIVPPLAPGAEFNSPFSTSAISTPGSYAFCATADATFLVTESMENNTDCEGFTVLPMAPDLVPGSMYFGSGQQSLLCNLVDPMLSVSNIGTMPSGTFNVQVHVYRDAVFQQTVTFPVATISALGSTSLTLSGVYSTAGHYSFEVECDTPLPNGSVAEWVETNNTAIFTRTVIGCAADLVVNGCNGLTVPTVDPLFPGTATYSAVVRNVGTAIATGPIDVSFVVSNGDSYTTQITGSLAPGASSTVTVTGATVAPATATLTATADPNNTISEGSEGNNSASGSLCQEFTVEPVCGFGANYWEQNYALNQTTPLYVGLRSSGLYRASAVAVRFEVSGPGIVGTVLLGDVTVPNVSPTCACPIVASLPTTFLFDHVGIYTFTMTADPLNARSECNEANNVLVRQITVNNLPDLRVLAQYIAPSLLNPDVGEAITLNVTYENIGQSNLADEFSVAVEIDGVPFATVPNLSGLLSGTDNTVAIPGTYSSTVIGVHTIRAIVDAGGSVTEGNEVNNEAIRAFVVGPAANLYFSAFGPSVPSPLLGQTIQVDATVSNGGDAPINGSIAFFYLNSLNVEVSIGILPISVAAQGSISVQLPWTVAQIPTTLIGRIVNVTGLESDYTDNEASFVLGAFDLALTSAPACANNPGSLTAAASNGEAPFTYLWSNGTIGAQLLAVPGTYTVSVTDANGAFASASGTIGVAAADGDNDGTPDCADGCPADGNKIVPGACGCGMVDTDSDNDGLADCLDPCPVLPGLSNGQPCDDGNPLTSNDIVADCICTGVLTSLCDDPLALNYIPPPAVTDNSTCTYCTPTVNTNVAISAPIMIGTGIPASNASVAINCNDIEVGLAAYERFVGPLVPMGNVYASTVGNSPTSASDPTPASGLARWNYLLSVDLGAYDFTDVRVLFDMDFDPAPGDPSSWHTGNISQFMIDNSAGTQHVHQSTENFGFPYWGTVFPDVTFDPNLQGTYDLRVRLESMHTDAPLLSMSIRVEVSQGVLVAAKVMLDGAYESNTDHMHDLLRSQGLIPKAQPYTMAPFYYNGSEEVDPSVLANSDPDDAIVDWVLLEVRDELAPATVLQRRAALVQRDGDIVDLNGISMVRFPGVAGGDYMVSVRHRNHLGALSASIHTVSAATPLVVDFTNTAMYGSNAQKLRDGHYMLWSGNTNEDGRLRYAGSSNDRDPILAHMFSVMPAPTVNSVVEQVYRNEDTNLDGLVKYAGQDNDRDPILVNIGGTTITYTRMEQLP